MLNNQKTRTTIIAVKYSSKAQTGCLARENLKIVALFSKRDHVKLKMKDLRMRQSLRVSVMQTGFLLLKI